MSQSFEAISDGLIPGFKCYVNFPWKSLNYYSVSHSLVEILVIVNYKPAQLDTFCINVFSISLEAV